MIFIGRQSTDQQLINHFYVTGHESYRIAKLRPLHRSRSFKVTDFGTNRKPIYDFLLVINTNLPPILYRFQVTADYNVKFSLTTAGRYILTHSLGVIPANIPTSDIPLKTRFFGLHFTPRMYRCIFNHFCVIGPKSYRIRRNNANYTAITPFKVIPERDGQTDRIPLASTALCIASNADAL